MLLKTKLGLSSLYALYLTDAYLSSSQQKIMSNCQKEVNKKNPNPGFFWGEGGGGGGGDWSQKVGDKWVK